MFFFSKRIKKATREEEEAFREKIQKEDLERKDVPAMLLAAFLTLILPCLVVLLVLCGIAMLIFL